MNKISRQRFEAIAGYCRLPSLIPTRECEFFAVQQERLIGFILFEGIDNEYGGIVLGRDKNGRFRWISGTRFSESIDTAREYLRVALDEQSQKTDESFEQGDEPRLSATLLRPIVAENRLGTLFKALISNQQFSPARELIQALSPYFRDVDGNFIEQFPTTAFDARLTELYYFATLHEMGYAFDQSEKAPDFNCIDPWSNFYVEVVTAQPTIGAEIPNVPKTFEEAKAYTLGYAATKFGSALYSKLQKRYWDRPHVRGKPLVFAVQNFSNALSVMKTSTALSAYLYGWHHESSSDANGNLIITPSRIYEHRYRGKTIPSNFFGMPGSENVSAVLHNPEATISKFNRMGILAGFGANGAEYYRVGTFLNHDPNASQGHQLSVNVRDESYNETWAEGLCVYHNPRALYPLDQDAFPGSAHAYLREDGNMQTFTPKQFPLGTMTMCIMPVPKKS